MKHLLQIDFIFGLCLVSRANCWVSLCIKECDENKYGNQTWTRKMAGLMLDLQLFFIGKIHVIALTIT